ncbi:MAG: hypothetical protein RLZZ381_251 [Cyanobacteriota bacterium]|jgi:hypothetical protein
MAQYYCPIKASQWYSRLIQAIESLSQMHKLRAIAILKMRLEDKTHSKFRNKK